MFEDLTVAEVAEVAPHKTTKKKEELPAAIRQAYDSTEMDKAREITIQAPAGWEDKLAMMAARLLGMLKRYATSTKTVAFKASASSYPDGKIVLYWQKKPQRQKKTEPTPAPGGEGDGGGAPNP